MSVVARVFVAAYLGVVGIWLSPTGWPGRERLVELERPLVDGLGLWQQWSMFAPEPMLVNQRLDCFVRTRAGRELRWEVGAPEAGRIRRDRERKWIESLLGHCHPLACADAAAYLASTRVTPAEAPVHVKLTRTWSQVPHVHWDESPSPLDERHEVVYKGDVTAASMAERRR